MYLQEFLGLCMQGRRKAAGGARCRAEGHVPNAVMLLNSDSLGGGTVNQRAVKTRILEVTSVLQDIALLFLLVYSS